MAVSNDRSKAMVRLAGTKDVAALVLLNEGLFAEDAGTRDPFTFLGFDGHDYFTDLVTDAHHNVAWAADVGGTVVGYLAGRFRAPNEFRCVSTGVLESMFVDPAHRNTGVGTALVETFLEWARNNGAGSVAVTAYADNAGAIRFYQRFGLRPKHVTLDMAI